MTDSGQSRGIDYRHSRKIVRTETTIDTCNTTTKAATNKHSEPATPRNPTRHPTLAQDPLRGVGLGLGTRLKLREAPTTLTARDQ